MRKEDLEKFKGALQKTKGDLEKELGSVAEVPDLGSDVESDSFDQEADEAEEMVNNASVRASLKETLMAVERALDKIQKGTYGKCEKCGGEIGQDLLEVDPESSHCKNCKKH